MKASQNPALIFVNSAGRSRPLPQDRFAAFGQLSQAGFRCEPNCRRDNPAPD